jgi:hypothetical protein
MPMTPTTMLTTMAALMLGGCSTFDQLALNSGSTGVTLNPSKIYLQGFESIDVFKRDIEDYACVDGPLMCHTQGMSAECRCLSAF